MKKFCLHVRVILLIFAFVFSFSAIACADVPIDDAHFPDSTFRAYIISNFDTNHDGIMNQSEIENARKLDIDGYYVKSLKGIEYLTALTEINCQFNGLTELDISRNSALIVLNCNCNLLTTIHLSNCTALQWLSCEGNKLTAIDVSSNLNLEYLNCSYNRIQELDLSNNVALMYLNCSYNYIPKLDLSNNVNLGYSKKYGSGCIFLHRVNINGFADITNWGGYNVIPGLVISPTTNPYGDVWNSYWYQIDFNNYVPYAENIDYIRFVDEYGYTTFVRHSFKDKGTNLNGVVKFELHGNGTGYFPQISALDATQYVEVNIRNDEDVIHGCRIYRGDVPIPKLELPVPKSVNIQVDVLEGGLGIDKIICSMDTEHYFSRDGQLSEESIADYSHSEYGKLGFVADGNSRLIVRVKSNKPGYASFFVNGDAGVKLERLIDRTSSEYSVQANEISDGVYQASVVLIAPESFPTNRKFPSDKFSLDVVFHANETLDVTMPKYVAKRSYITSDAKTIELKIEAAPVLLIPGRVNEHGLFLSSWGDANNTFGVNSKTGIFGELLKIGFKEEHIALLDYDSTTGVKNNLHSLFKVLSSMFNSYAEKGIVCTKADVVAHGLGGLLVRQFLGDSDKVSSISNWSIISYRQGMIHKVVNIAVPHRGTPLANIMLGDMSVIKDDLPLGTERLAYRAIKYFPAFCSEILATPAQWKDLAVGSDVTNLPFPANVPMHFIYGDVTNSLDKLEGIKDVVFLLQGIFSIVKSIITLPGRVDELAEASAPLDKLFTRALLEDGVMDEKTFNEVAKLIGRNNMLRFQEFMKTELEIAKTGMSVAEMAKFSSNVTGLMQIGGVALGGVAGLLKTPIDLYFVIPRLIFSDQPHDLFVPKWSAIAAFPEYSTCFPVTPGIFDLWHFKYGEICHQAGVAEFVGYLLKDAPMSKFAVLKESVPLPGSVNALPETVKASSTKGSDADIEIDFDNFYVNNFDLTTRKSTREVFSNGMTALKFIAKSSVKTSSDVKLVVQKDGLDRIFPMFTEDGHMFSSILVFQSGDEGLMKAYCYAPSGKGNLCISNTVEFSYLDKFTDEEPETAPTPPKIKTEILKNAITGREYSYQLTASGTATITWTKSGTLPKGITLNSSGLISGTPAKAGKYTFTVTAKNSYGKSQRKFVLNVIDPVSITTASLKTGTITKSYSFTMSAKGSKTITWSAEGLPNGLTINEKGKISGTPAVYGKFTVKITARNEAGSVVKSLPLEIKAIAPKLSGSLAKPTLNEPYSSALKVTGSEPVTWSITGKLPDGLTFDTSTGKISGTPKVYAKSGWKITITAANYAGRKSKNITLKVNGIAPKITAKLPGATAGENYSAEITATGSKAITFTADLPEYLTLNGNTITGKIPESTKSFKIKVYASNPVKTVSKTYTVKVSTKKKSIPETVRAEIPEIHRAENGTDIMENNTGLNTEVIADMPVNSGMTLASSSDYVIAVELGEVSCDLQGMYDFNIELPDYIAEGSELIYFANSDMPSEDDDIAEFYDDAGGKISAVPENRRITISIWLNPDTTYNPVIAVKH